MTLRAVESIRAAEDGRWKEKEDGEQPSVARTAKHPNAVSGCPQVSAISLRLEHSHRN